VLILKDEMYEPVEDVWNKTKDQSEVISKEIVESQGEYFERVYESPFNKAAYLTAEGLKKLYQKKFKK
jgi:hypothetical protein